LELPERIRVPSFVPAAASIALAVAAVAGSIVISG